MISSICYSYLEGIMYYFFVTSNYFLIVWDISGCFCYVFMPAISETKKHIWSMCLVHSWGFFPIFIYEFPLCHCCKNNMHLCTNREKIRRNRTNLCFFTEVYLVQCVVWRVCSILTRSRNFHTCSWATEEFV